ncbi:adrenodoxin-like [Amphiura filiformis]|uniref:adrenodoxin-like n=1 Tax=Amphiura filiformis TaxID=82378 RepID=UPI003B21A1D1
MATSVGRTLTSRLPSLIRICQSSGSSVAQNSTRTTTVVGSAVGRKLVQSNQVHVTAAHTRLFSSSAAKPANKEDALSVTYINRDGDKSTVKTEIGQNLLDIAVDNDLDIEGFGACEGTLACSTCHLIFEQKHFDMLPKPSDEELDMLDLAYGLEETSRLGCQCILTKEMDGLTVMVPETIHDAREA